MINNGNGVYTEIVKSRLHVMVPHNDKFVVFAHSMDARWKRRSGIWSFERIKFARVAIELNRIYGTVIKNNLDGKMKAANDTEVINEIS
jgi:hypothetical protein